MDTGDEGSSLGTCSSISMSLISFVGEYDFLYSFSSFHLVKNFNLDILDFRILTSNESGYDHEV